MSIIIGYFIFVCYMIMLLLIHSRIQHQYPLNNSSIEEYIFAGNNIPFGLLAPSIFVSWLWVTTIVGSAEAGVRYGFSGGWAYSLGAAAAFALFIPIVIKIKRMMPGSITFLDFMGARFSNSMKDIYYIFAILIVIYVVVEQSAGIALVFNGLFHVSFKKIAFFAVLLAGAYIIMAGMRGVLFNELVNFFLISIGFIVFAAIVIGHFDMALLYEGMKEVQSNPLNNGYNPEALKLLSKSGTMYALSAVIIALGQLCVDPAYYLKAHIAKNETTVIKSFLSGGVLLWIPVPIISAIVIGNVTLSKNFDFTHAVNISINISTKILMDYFGDKMQILFAILIFCIGMTSIIHCLIGIQGIFTLDFYKRKINYDATDIEKMKFGKIVVFLIALLCALIAISLERVSLLTIDTFSGIFFAAPCGAILAGIFSKKDLGNKALVSVVAGIAAGLISWLMIPDANLNWLYGTLFSFITPVLFLLLFTFTTKKKFNFFSLFLFTYNFEESKKSVDKLPGNPYNGIK